MLLYILQFQLEIREGYMKKEGIETIHESEQLENALIRSIVSYNKYLSALKGIQYERVSYNELEIAELINIYEKTQRRLFKALQEKGFLPDMKEKKKSCKEDYDHIWKRTSPWHDNHVTIGQRTENDFGWPVYHQEALHECKKCKRKVRIRR